MIHIIMASEAYVMIAYGDKYVLEAINLVKSIKKFDTTRDFVLVSNITSHELFDKIINIVVIANGNTAPKGLKVLAS